MSLPDLAVQALRVMRPSVSEQDNESSPGYITQVLLRWRPIRWQDGGLFAKWIVRVRQINGRLRLPASTPKPTFSNTVFFFSSSFSNDLVSHPTVADQGRSAKMAAVGALSPTRRALWHQIHTEQITTVLSLARHGRGCGKVREELRLPTGQKLPSASPLFRHLENIHSLRKNRHRFPRSFPTNLAEQPSHLSDLRSLF